MNLRMSELKLRVLLACEDAKSFSGPGGALGSGAPSYGDLTVQPQHSYLPVDDAGVLKGTGFGASSTRFCSAVLNYLAEAATTLV